MLAQNDHMLGRQASGEVRSTSNWVCPGYYQDISYISKDLGEAEGTNVALGIWIPETRERLSPSGELSVDEFGRVQLGSPDRFARSDTGAILRDEYSRVWLDPFPERQGSVHILDYSEGRIEADVNFDSAGILVHSTTYVSGWKATVDDIPTPVFRINDLLQGIDVPSGEHRVEFVYRPDRFAWGSVISAVSFIAVLSTSIWLEYNKENERV